MSPTIFLNRQQTRRVDQLAVEEFGFSSLVLMENAGRGVADVLCRLGIDGPVVLCCGKGNNAGDGFVIARHLELRGHKVRVLLWADPGELTGDAAVNFYILMKIGVTVEYFHGGGGSPYSLRCPNPSLTPVVNAERLDDLLNGAAWIVDALLGTGSHGEPRPPLDFVIDRMNAAAAPKLAVDVPSGLDCDTGQPAQHTVRATETCTFVAPKPGFSTPEAAPYVGRLHVLDIGVPKKVIDRAASVSRSP